MCEYEGCDYFPQYGVGPHMHQITHGSFINSTIPVQKIDWPKNYVEDPECPGLGVYYCPECFSEMPVKRKVVKKK